MSFITTKLSKINIKTDEAQRLRTRIILDYPLDKPILALYSLASNIVDL
jgi:hypothetical protein